MESSGTPPPLKEHVLRPNPCLRSRRRRHLLSHVGAEVLTGVTDCEVYGLLICNIAQFADRLMLLRNISATFSGSKSKPSKKPPARRLLQMVFCFCFPFDPEDESDMFFETSDLLRTTLRHISKDHILGTHCRVNLKVNNFTAACPTLL
jgi:hypothetical protein